MPAPSQPLGAREVRLRWELGAVVKDATPLGSRALSLVVEGAASRRVDFAAGTGLRAPTATERRNPVYQRGALTDVMLDTADEGARAVSITRQGDVLRVHVASSERAHGERPVIIAQRVALPPGASVTVAPLP